MLGATCSAIGLGIASFPVMCLGGLLLGYAVANMQLYRFAAVELAPGPFRAQAISYVTSGGVIAGIVGPTLARWTPDLWIPTFQASFVAVIVIHAIVLTILGFIEFPVVKAEDATGPQRPLLEIVTQPAYMVAAAGGMIAFGVMSFVMAASPLAIVQCGLDKGEAPITIFVHVMGMFVPAFFTGHLIQRFGVFNMMTAGIALLIAGVAIALMGTTEWYFRGALGLNGVGLEFPVRRRHHPADHDLPAGRARQSAGIQRLHGVRHHRDRQPDGFGRARGGGLGNAELHGLRAGLRGDAGDRYLPPAQSRPRLSPNPLTRWGFCVRPLLRVRGRSVIFRPPRAGGETFHRRVPG
jgi:MFS family permease